jgi:hypothetical protein
VAFDAKLCIVLPTPPIAPLTPARAPFNAPEALLTRSFTDAVMPFSPVPISPLRRPTVESRLDLREANVLLFIAPLAASDAALTCSDTDETNFAKGLIDNDILSDYS